MCGLVAMVSKSRNGFSSKNFDMFDILLFVDQMRGQDSTGVYQVNNLGNVSIAKKAVNSTDFLNEAAYKNLRVDGIRNGWAMVGHNRKATRGTINDQNAHPFWVDDKVVLVHNGSYYGDHKHLKETEVDSEAIAHVLADEPDVDKAMQQINAAYALIWYDIPNKTLNVLRNKERPLFWVETHECWYFASEPDFIEFAAKRTNTTLIGEVASFDEGSHDKWILKDDKTTELTTKDVDTRYRSEAERKGRSVVEAITNLVRPTIHLTDGGTQTTSRTPSEIRLEHEARCDAIAAVLKAQQAEKREREEKKKRDGETVVVTVDNSKWQTAHTFKQWFTCKNKYDSGTRVRVECKDYLSDDAGPGMVYLTGRTVNEDKLYAVFPVAKELFDAITRPDSEAFANRKCEFMVDIETCKWRPSEERKVGQNIEDQRGVITLIGKKAKIYSSGETLVQ